jgi:hypothetical protein
MEDFHSAFYVDRGIDAGVAKARGYRFWDEETYNDVMEEVYGDLGDRTRSVMAFARMVGRQGQGVAFPRHAPKGGFRPITAGLRPDKPVKLAPPKRHYHGAPGVHLMDIEIWSLVPENVTLLYGSPQRGRVKIYFEHEHNVFDTSHSEVWHPQETEDRNHPEGGHGHTFYIYETVAMRKHIAQTKNPDSHCGFNPSGVHSHQKRAKYLYTPSIKTETAWHTDHEHDNLKGKILEHHLAKYHADEASASGESHGH